MKKYSLLLLFWYAPMLIGMMPEDAIIGSGVDVSFEQLPAQLIYILWQIPDQVQNMYTYSNADNILAVSTSNSLIKIFKHEDDGFRHLYNMTDSQHPAVDPTGTIIAVIKNKDNKSALALYARQPDDSFIEQQSIGIDKTILKLAFNDDGTQLNVTSKDQDGKKDEHAFSFNDGNLTLMATLKAKAALSLFSI